MTTPTVEERLEQLEAAAAALAEEKARLERDNPELSSGLPPIVLTPGTDAHKKHERDEMFRLQRVQAAADAEAAVLLERERIAADAEQRRARNAPRVAELKVTLARFELARAEAYAQRIERLDGQIAKTRRELEELS